jgi:hypothetical protein
LNRWNAAIKKIDETHSKGWLFFQQKFNIKAAVIGVSYDGIQMTSGAK